MEGGWWWGGGGGGRGRTHCSRAFFISKGTKCRANTLYTTAVAIWMAILGVGAGGGAATPPPPPPSSSSAASAGTTREITSTKSSTSAFITMSCETVFTRAVRFKLKKAHFLSSCDMQASPLMVEKAVRSEPRTPSMVVSAAGRFSTQQRISSSGPPPSSTFAKTKGSTAPMGYRGSGAGGSCRSWAPATRVTGPSRAAVAQKSIGGWTGGGGGGGGGGRRAKVLSASYSAN